MIDLPAIAHADDVLSPPTITFTVGLSPHPVQSRVAAEPVGSRGSLHDQMRDR